MGRKSLFYPDDLLNRVIEAGGGPPDDDREVEVTNLLAFLQVAMVRIMMRRIARRSAV